MASQVESSMLGAHSVRVIPNAIDTDIFQPGQKESARLELGLPANAFICLFVAVSGKETNPYKDYPTIEKAIKRLTELIPGEEIWFVCLGGRMRASETRGRRVFPGIVRDSRRVARFYQAADVYLHAANADNFPCTVLEAQACALPVVATAVGGVPEQVEEGLTGWMVPRGDDVAMAERVLTLWKDRDRRTSMRHGAALRAAKLFNLQRQVDDYLYLYRSLMDGASSPQASRPAPGRYAADMAFPKSLGGGTEPYTVASE
jgi:glycosyltransferase involved in cell wall biosynthesis